MQRLPYRSECQNLASPLVNASQQIKDAVNNTTSQIAAERTDQHCLNIDVGPRRDTERADEGEGHDQAEQGFRDPFHRIQYVTKESIGNLRHSSPPRLIKSFALSSIH